MFDNYVGAKQVRRSKWITLLIVVSISIHVVVGAAVVIKSLWTLTKLEPPDTELALSSPPPPPPPPPAGAKKPKVEAKKIVRKVKETVQPDMTKKPEPEQVQVVEDEGVEGGVEGGVSGGVLGGVEGGVLGGVQEPPKPEAPKVVPQVALEAQRISGEKEIQPPNDVATQMARSGKGTVGVVKMCLTDAGTIKSLNMLKSTSYPAYDAKIKSKMHEWRYRPFMVNGKPVPVCTSVTFIYRPR